MNETIAFFWLAGILLILWLFLEIKASPSLFSIKQIKAFLLRQMHFLRRNLIRIIAIYAVLALLSFWYFQNTIVSHTMYSTEQYCSLHHRSTQLTLLEISYGLSAVDAQSNSARSELFPLSNSSFSGGCCVGVDGFYKWTMYCPDCRRAEEAWWRAGRK
jgi:hypothetical protein